jgi:hypothetical protein
VFPEKKVEQVSESISIYVLVFTVKELPLRLHCHLLVCTVNNVDSVRRVPPYWNCDRHAHVPAREPDRASIKSRLVLHTHIGLLALLTAQAAVAIQPAKAEVVRLSITPHKDFAWQTYSIAGP